jgi:diguanylate cyclase (GGDEF)-like protein/PAS domain S-box-containing protein
VVSEADLSALEDLAELIGAHIRDRERLTVAKELLAGTKDPMSYRQEELAHLYIELLARADKTVEDLKLMSARLDAATQLQLRTGLELWAREEELRNVIENSSDAFISTTDKGVITAWNRQAQTIFGWTAQEALGREVVTLLMLSGRPDGVAATAVRRRLGQQRGARLEVPAVTRDGRQIFVELRSAVVAISDRQIISIFMHDISERKQTELQHAYEAEHDWLTGIPNRRALVRELASTLSPAESHSGNVALLFVDLDGFKRVNDDHGHNVGDGVLKIVTQRAASVLRKSDRLFRLGGDEFVVLMGGGATIGNEGVAVANRLIDAVSRPISLGGNTLSLGASVGMAIAPRDGKTSTDELIKRADAQMYLAKSAGRGRVFKDEQDLNHPRAANNA